MNKELISRLYSTEADVRKNAVYNILFGRIHELIPELKKAAFYEKDESIAVLLAQTCLTLEAFPRDYSIERQILEFLEGESGLTEMSRNMWDYLSSHGNSQMLIAAMGAMNDTIPPKAQEFMENCLNHLDPEVRAAACGISIKSGRPTHFAHVLNLITDPDPMVAATAFSVVKGLPVSQLTIILDYALGSPDEWVLQNVAPFLPLLITNELRTVIAKVQYHQHPLVSKKAREALKHLDTIPYVSKNLKEKHDAAEAAKKEGSEDGSEKASGDGKNDGEFASFKEKMEQKRVQKMEEERKKKEEDERVASEIAETSEEELESFAGSLESFEVEMGETSGSDDELEVEADKPLLENLDFENEQAVLEEVNDEVNFDRVVEEMDAAAALESIDEIDLSAEQVDLSVERPEEDVNEIESTAAKEELPAEIASSNVVEPAIVPDFEEISSEIEKKVELPDKIEKSAPISLKEPVSKENVEDQTIEVDIEDDNELDLATVEVEDVSLDVPDADDIQIEVLTEVQSKVPDKVPAMDSARTPVPEKVTPDKKESAKPAPVKKVAEEKIPEGAIVIPPNPAAQTIVSRFPSFLADPFAELFKPALPETHLKNIQLVLDNLLAYLNLCYLQSSMFFAPPSDVVIKSVKECLKGHLIGPTAIRCLHNFALAMKQSRENPVFFTFSLASIISESSDTNPLMMMRELKEYLKAPIDPVEETLPQAVEGLVEILRGLKSILNNSIVMKAPKGAKEPFADLSGPLATVLAADKRPGIELPEGEIVVISRDGSEALGLFPYFKYARRKVVFARPDAREFAVLLERLEIDLT